MIKYYTNKELSERFGINIARWKRWSREFLEADPLGGLQSGYARQYHPADAFHIFLCGHLVAELKYSIAATKMIYKDLQTWLKEHGFLNLYNSEKPANNIKESAKEYFIYIQEWKNQKKPVFSYTIRELILKEECELQGEIIFKEHYKETLIKPISSSTEIENLTLSLKYLNITLVYQYFCNKLRYGFSPE